MIDVCFVNRYMDVCKNSNNNNSYHTFYNIVVNYHIGNLSMFSNIYQSMYTIHDKRYDFQIDRGAEFPQFDL
jgi:hypothetical protein